MIKTLLILFISIIAIQAIDFNRNEIPTKISPFGESFKLLYGGIKPPKPTNTTRARNLNVMVEWITQKVDNFNPNSPTWNMRYMSNGDFHKPGGPIIIFIGGEGDISDGWLRSGLLFDMTREHSGYLFTTEHRYYGQSIPTNDLSTGNLQYLSSYQALADLANFVRTQKAKPQFANSKVIVASGSYPGALTVWFQKLYPDLVDGSWASSAPLQAKVEFPEYKEVVATAFKQIGGDACYNRLYYGIRKLEELADTKQFGELSRIMKICNNWNGESWKDVASMFSSIANVAAGVVQNYNNGDIVKDCQTIMAGADDASGVANWYYSKIGSAQCYDYTFAASVGHLKTTQVTSSMWRQWTYQLCTEFGYSHTSKSLYQPFGTKIVVQFYEWVCYDVFGIGRDQFYASIDKTNNYYGGLTPNIRNVYYSHGGIDPWYPAGIQTNDDGTTAIIPLYGHCKDFGSVSSYDSAEMRASKEKLQRYVRKWLA